MAEIVRSLEIEALFVPHDVRAYSAHARDTWIDELRDEERHGSDAMSAGRRAEFATARACARAAMLDLGHDAAVPRRQGGAPQWPRDVTGSISHTQGVCVAVASPVGIALGIDIEEIGRIKPSIERRILTDRDRSHLEHLDDDTRRQHVATIFATKEAFYKAHYEVDPRYLGFDAITVRVGAADEPQTDVSITQGSGAVDSSLFAAVTSRRRIESGRVIAAVSIDTSRLTLPLPSPA